ncbi:helix-turn-helix transcriptional regulator [Streptomyces soliscabiei]|uniref:helix-turn-helix transcriptional regulator n=1 Tax=Streptomyces soliscabiei TaxID=588897 RepID=UPI0029B9EFC6|nr:AAA family ATPase [Streptomyces sp. NY05-11A]MDX2681866.1 AAA family ATPase [Streptomyces sp. NY05-11A]
MVERMAPLADLEESLIASRGHAGRIVLLSGAVGMGKSELLHTFAKQASASCLYLGAVGHEHEREVPLGVVRQLVRDLRLPPPLHAQMTLLESLLAAGPTTSRNAVLLQTRVAHGLCDTLLRLTNTSRLLIGVDDIQHADDASLACLLHLLPLVRSAPVMLVIVQPDGGSRHPLLDEELRRHPHCRRVRITGLSPEGAVALTERRLGAEEARRLGPVYHSLCGGSPLLLRALLEDRHCRSAACPGGAPDGPYADEEFRHAVLACLRRHEAVVSGVARLLAALEDTSTPERLSRLLGTSTTAVRRALSQLEASGLTQGTGFRHPATREVILEDAPPDLISEAHTHAAQLLHQQGASSLLVARHLAAAGHVRDGWAHSALSDAAEAACLRDDLPFAVTCLELALGSADDPDVRALTAAKLIQLEWRINPAAVERRLDELVEAALGGRLPQVSAVSLVRSLLWFGRRREAVSLLDLLSASERTCPLLLGQLHAWLRIRHPSILLRPSPVPGSEPASGVQKTASGPAAVSADGLLSLTLRGGGGEATARTAEQTLSTCRLETTGNVDSVESALLTLLYTGRRDRAAHWSARYAAAVAARPTPTWQARITVIQAEIALRQGDLTTALHHVRSAVTLVPLRSWGLAVGWPISVLVLAASAMGAYEVAEEQLRFSVPEAMFDSWYGIHYLYARGHHHLAAKRLDAALGDFLACGEKASAWNMDLPMFVAWRSAAATAHLGLGHREEARRLVEEELARPGPAKSSPRGVALRLLADFAEPRRRVAILNNAVTLQRLTGDRLELARSLAALGSAQRALGKAGPARQALHQALRLSEQCGAAPLHRNLLTDDTDHAPEPPAEDAEDPLTATQRRVASLASWGHSNREIAEKLCVTVSTVEQHLTRIYRKLNVTGRAKLISSYQDFTEGGPEAQPHQSI